MSADGARTGGQARSSANEAMHEEEALGKAYDARLLGRLWPYVRCYGWQVALTLTLVFPIFAVDFAPAWIIKTGLDRVILPEGAGGTAPLRPRSSARARSRRACSRRPAGFRPSTGSPACSPWPCCWRPQRCSSSTCT